ncbi:MAG: acyl carrier protein [Rhodobacteraceae bacterium]|nr:acyl carrier protein [Paracoccaceae bacterium]PHR62284.1 MAG: hypothetical protein COA47_04745 [Robiginitomaculum sp.]
MNITATQLQTFVQTNLLAGQSVATDENMLLSGLVDSLGVMTLVSHLETEAGIHIPPEDVILENFATINAIIAYLGQRS